MLTKAALEAILTEVTGVGGEFHGIKVGLATNNVTPSPVDVLASYTQATYTGYALSAALTWGTPYVNAAGQGEVLGGLVTFQPSDGVTSNMISNVIATDGAGAVLIGAIRFDSAISLPDQNSALVLVPTLNVGDQGVTLSFQQV